ncbi:MAG: hypothetical protein IH820_12230 [Bacteroidetes bacterium]|nr:hypothetical protein [Bacteroidota bacterium]
MNLVVISFYIVMALMGLGLLSILLFGVRSFAWGKVNKLTLMILCVPIGLLFVLGFVIGDWARAGILTIAIMLGLAVFSLLATGIKGLFT